MPTRVVRHTVNRWRCSLSPPLLLVSSHFPYFYLITFSSLFRVCSYIEYAHYNNSPFKSLLFCWFFTCYSLLPFDIMVIGSEIRQRTVFFFLSFFFPFFCECVYHHLNVGIVFLVSLRFFVYYWRHHFIYQLGVFY